MFLSLKIKIHDYSQILLLWIHIKIKNFTLIFSKNGLDKPDHFISLSNYLLNIKSIVNEYGNVISETYENGKVILEAKVDDKLYNRLKLYTKFIYPVDFF